MNDDMSIIKFRPKPRTESDAPIVQQRSIERRCDHKQVCIDLRARRLTCSKCGVEMDPYAYINHLDGNFEIHKSLYASVRSENEKREKLLREQAENDRLSALRRLSEINPGATMYIEWLGDDGRAQGDLCRLKEKKRDSMVVSVLGGECEIGHRSIISLRKKSPQLLKEQP